MIIQLSSRDRFLVGAGLILLSAAAWTITLQSMLGNTMSTMDETMPQTWVPENLFLFLGAWSVMMAAMMLPSMFPMVATYTAAVRSQHSATNAYARTAVFVSGCLLVWGAVGLVFYAADTVASTLQNIFPNLGLAGPLLTGGLLILAGVYELSPLKDRCLTGCRTPLGFVASRWQEGFGGGFRMGLEHGLYCLGCCGAMLVALVVFGLMNLPVMVLLTLWILAEKLLPFGFQVTKFAAVGFIVSGILVFLFPSLLSGI